MHPQYLSFQIRLTTTASVDEVRAEIEKVIHLPMLVSTHKQFKGRDAYEFTALGIWITLTYIESPSDRSLKNYSLTGNLDERVGSKWDVEKTSISISEYILTLFELSGVQGWYIPTKEEKKNGPDFR